MKNLLLVYGESGAGKTWLSSHLKTDYYFEILSTDLLYVDFIKSKCPDLYFKYINYYIGPHYDNILIHRDYSKKHFGRDFVEEWHNYLLTKIAEKLSMNENLVVEGYLLLDYKEELEKKFRGNANVFQIEVRNKKYFFQNSELSLGQIGSLI